MTGLDCLVERGSHLPENGKFLYSTERTLSKIAPAMGDRKGVASAHGKPPHNA